VTETNLVTAIRDTLHDEMAADDRLVLLGEDVGARGGVFKVSQGFLDEFGEQRVIDTPLAESGLVGVAIGMAMHGMLPIAEIEFADFIHPAFDQIVSEAARMRYRTNADWTCPMVIRAPCGGGIHGALYHSQSIEAFYAHIPGLKVVMPSQPDDARLLLKAAIRDENPVLFVEHRDCYPRKGEVGDDPEEVGELGVGRVLREGSDCTIVAWGGMPWAALEAAEQLEAEDGISLEIIDPRTLQPLDMGLIIESVRKTNRCVVAHEAVTFGGFGAEVAALVQEHAFDHLDAPVLRVGEKWAPVPFAPVLEAHVVPGTAEIIEAVRSVAYATA
jgi:2-oxoisovalerate dehydrogenase E1 component beta subunit